MAQPDRFHITQGDARRLTELAGFDFGWQQFGAGDLASEPWDVPDDDFPVAPELLIRDMAHAALVRGCV